MAFNAGAVLIRVLPDMRGFEAAVHASTRTLGQRVGRIGAGLTRGVTLPLVAAGAASVKLAIDFETSMGKIQGLVGISAKQTEAWSKQLLELARTGPVGPRELAESLYFVASSGIAVKDAMEVVRVSARAAATGLGSTVEVADLLTSAINVFGIENLSAAQAADVLVAAVREGKGEADEYAEALGRVLPVADLLGVSFDETAAAASALTLGGLDIYESVTALRQAFNAFIKPSVAGKETFRELGTSIEEVRKSVAEKGLIDTLIDLRARLVNAGFGEVFEEIEKNGVSSLTELRDKFGENADALGKIFPNIRGLVGFLSLTGDGVAHNKEVFDELAHSVGDADKAFNVVAETTQFKMQKALSSIQATAIQFGQLLLPAVEAVAEFFGGLADLFGSFSEDTRETILIFAGVAAAIGPLLVIIGHLITKTGLWVTLAALVATVIIKNWKHIVPIIQAVRDWIVDTWRSATRAFKPFIDRIMEIVPTFEEIKEAAINTWNAIVSGAKKVGSFVNRFVVKPIMAAFRFLKPIAIAVYNWFVKYIVGGAIAVWEMLVRLWDFLKGDLLNVFKAIGAVIMENIWPAIMNLWDAFMNLWPVIEGVAKIIGAVLLDAFQILWPIIQVVVKIIITLVAWFIKIALKVIPIVIRAFGLVVQAITWIIEQIAAVIGWIGQFIAAAAGVAEKVGQFFVRAWEIIKGAWGGLVGFFKTIWWGVEDVVVVVGNAIINAFEVMVNGVIDGINWLIQGMNKIPGVEIDKLGNVSFTAMRVSFDNFVNDVPPGKPADSKTEGNTVGAGQRLAKGGIVTRPTIALIGEAGPEAVIPLGKGGDDIFEIRITNWETGQGQMRKLARTEVDDDRDYRERIGRFGRNR